MDQLFKEPLQAFFPEFMELFFPVEAARLGFTRGVSFRDGEAFTDVPDRRARRGATRSGPASRSSRA